MTKVVQFFKNKIRSKALPRIGVAKPLRRRRDSAKGLLYREQKPD